MQRPRRLRRPEWKPTDEAFVVLRERDLAQALSEGLSLGAGYKLALRDMAGAQVLADKIFGDAGFAIIRVDMTGLADRVDPGAPVRRGEWVTFPSGIGDHTCLVGEIPASAITDATPELDGPTHPGPR